MNPQLTPLLAAVILVLAMIVFMVIALSRYMKVGPNQVLIVSGRKSTCRTAGAWASGW